MHPSVTLLRIVFGLTAIPLFCLLTGCFHNYYKAEHPNTDTLAKHVNTPAYQSRYFVLRNGDEAYHMRGLVVSEDRQFITCHLDSLPQMHMLHLYKGIKGNMRYKNDITGSAVLSEVHLYIPIDTTAKLNSTFTLPLKKVTKVEVIEKDKGKTTGNYILSAMGIVIGTIVLISLIAAAFKSSCPFVSAYDGNEMKLQGEIYGGAIYPQLCRNDYLPLEMKPAINGKLQLQISNELNEKQFTDLAELLVVTHNKDVRVDADENGDLHSISQPMLPIAAKVGDRNVMPLIVHANDSLSFDFDDTIAAKSNSNMIHLVFDKPADKRTAKLVLRLRNSYWLDMVYGKFTQGFGKYYSTFIQKQSTTPVEKLIQWKEYQQLPLHVSVQTSNSWETQHSLAMVGPLATREIALPLDLNNVTGRQVVVQLSAGFMFWQIDYAAIDYSDDTPLQISRLQPEKATDETGADVLPLLVKEDAGFLQQPVPGNATVIEYPYTPLTDSNQEQTYILHAKGYYEHVRNYTNAPDIGFLKQFRQPGALSNYSMDLYKQAMNTNVNSWALK